MIAFYGMGGGFGHLTRIKTFIENQEISEPYKVITANPLVSKFFSEEQILAIDANKQTTKEALVRMIHTAISGYSFDQLYIDTFPCGILGELAKEEIPCKGKNYLARRLIWGNYQDQAGSISNFDNTYRFEELEPNHQQFVDHHSNKVIDFKLKQSPPSPITHPALESSQPIWLIVHTTSYDELNLLINHAEDIATIERKSPQLVILSDLTNITLSNSAILLNTQNPLDWFSHADKIFSAAGFNTWYQLEPWRDIHIAIPFKRKFDDQFWRASSLN